VVLCSWHTIKQGAWLARFNFAREVEKLSVKEFSVVDIRLEAKGHVYGGTLFRILQALPVQSAQITLKVNLVGPEKSQQVILGSTYVPCANITRSTRFYLGILSC
jgi:hypothetical protein